MAARVERDTIDLLRHYIPKGTDLSVHSHAYLNKVARQLNEAVQRPSAALVGFDLHFHTLAKATLTGLYAAEHLSFAGWISVSAIRPRASSRLKALVLVRPASRQLQANGRPVFVVGINNLGKTPVDFRVAQVEATQRVGASDYAIRVVTFEMLAQEEKNRQVAAAILTGIAGAANAYGASQAGYGSYTTPSGRTGTFDSPTAATIAQNNAATENEAMFAATLETGQRNMAALERFVIKDNTLMPGEWYGGQLHLAPPTDQAGAQKTYTIVITVGNDRHVVDVAQGPAGT